MKWTSRCIQGLASLIVVAVASSSADASTAWNLERDSGNIQVYTRAVEGSPVKAVRAVTQLNAKMSSVVALLNDAGARPLWDDFCKESKVNKQISDTESLVYIHHALPWPVKDRDMLLHIVWSQDPNSLVAKMTSIATSGILAPIDDRVRVVDATNTWTLTLVGKDSIEVVSEVHLDPAGPIPAWLLNMLSTDAPYKSMQHIRQILSSGKYRDSHVAFIADQAP